MAADLPEGWKLLLPGWIAIPAEPSPEQWMEAQGTWLDMGWDATTCLAAHIQALIGITRREYEAAVAALPSGVETCEHGRLLTEHCDACADGVGVNASSDTQPKGGA